MTARRSGGSKTRAHKAADGGATDGVEAVKRRHGVAKKSAAHQRLNLNHEVIGEGQTKLATTVQSSVRSVTPPRTPISGQMLTSPSQAEPLNDSFKRPSTENGKPMNATSLVSENCRKRPLSPFSCPPSASTSCSPRVSLSTRDMVKEQGRLAVDSALDLLSDEPFDSITESSEANASGYAKLHESALPLRSSPVGATLAEADDGQLNQSAPEDFELTDVAHPSYLCSSFMTNLTCCNQSFDNLHDLEQHKESKFFHENDGLDLFNAPFFPLVGMSGIPPSFGPLMGMQPWCIPPHVPINAAILAGQFPHNNLLGATMPSAALCFDRWGNSGSDIMASPELLIKAAEPIFAHANCSSMPPAPGNAAVPIGDFSPQSWPAPAPDFNSMFMQTPLYRHSIDEIQKRLLAVSSAAGGPKFNYNQSSTKSSEEKCTTKAVNDSPKGDCSKPPKAEPNRALTGFRLDENEALIAMYRLMLAGLLPPIPGCDPSSILAAAAAASSTSSSVPTLAKPGKGSQKRQGASGTDSLHKATTRREQSSKPQAARVRQLTETCSNSPPTIEGNELVVGGMAGISSRDSNVADGPAPTDSSTSDATAMDVDQGALFTGSIAVPSTQSLSGSNDPLHASTFMDGSSNFEALSSSTASPVAAPLNRQLNSKRPRGRPRKKSTKV